MVAARLTSKGLPRVSAKQRATLELRRLLPIPEAGQQSVTYNLDTYMYFPRPFRVDKTTWGTSDFYRDAKVYLRFTAEGLSLRELGDLDHPQNPGAMLRRQMGHLIGEQAPSTKALATLARVYGAELADAMAMEAYRLRQLLRRTERKSRKALKKRAKLKPKKAKAKGAKRAERLSSLEDAVQRFCDDAMAGLGALRTVRAIAQAYRGVIHRSLFQSLAFAEEYAISVLDEELAGLAQRIETAPELREAGGVAARMRLRIAAVAETTYHRRVDQGFAVPWGKSAEYFTYRIGLLKKELQRSLYVDTRSQLTDPLLSNTAAMVAAGLAATWATLAQIPLWRGGLSGTQSVFFVTAAVGAYILKDRIKEWTRKLLSKRLLTWDHDRRISPGSFEQAGLGSVSGRARERVAFVKNGEIPAEITALRRANRTVEGASQHELEEVVHFRRSVSLDPSKEASLTEGMALQEIIRISLADMLQRLDEPSDSTEFFDTETRRFVSREVPRVYHLNVVVRAQRAEDGDVRLARYRVVVDREGVRKVEPVLADKLPG